MPAETTEYLRSDGSASRAFLDSVVALYAEVFAEPPYNEDARHVRRFRGWYKSEVRKPGFSLVRAVRRDSLVGIAYGCTMPAGEWWSNALDEGPAEIRDSDKFAVMEWAVRMSDRGRGVGERLMSRLLEDRREPYATLSVLPTVIAHEIYLRRGWTVVGRTRSGLFPSMDVLALALPGQERDLGKVNPPGNCPKVP